MYGCMDGCMHVCMSLYKRTYILTSVASSTYIVQTDRRVSTCEELKTFQQTDRQGSRIPDCTTGKVWSLEFQNVFRKLDPAKAQGFG